MDIKKRKELLSVYKNRHPEMGVVSFLCPADTTAKLNRVSAGQCPNKRPQELWAQYGRGDFEVSVVKVLEYDGPTENHMKELEKQYHVDILSEQISDYFSHPATRH